MKEYLKEKFGAIAGVIVMVAFLAGLIATEGKLAAYLVMLVAVTFVLYIGAAIGNALIGGLK